MKNICFIILEAASIWLNGSSYIVFTLDPKEEKSHSKYTYVAFSLRTKTPNGVIFSLRLSDKYLLIEMVHGKLRVEDLNLGQGKCGFNNLRCPEWCW